VAVGGSLLGLPSPWQSDSGSWQSGSVMAVAFDSSNYGGGFHELGERLYSLLSTVVEKVVLIAGTQCTKFATTDFSP
jgi:hypothetical protein